jgi:hypothetical protein
MQMSTPKYAIALLLAAPLFAAEGVPASAGLTVHEWGTFTSVAGEDGNPVPWSPLTGPSDLPCFVMHGVARKFELGPTLVRMETPVLYFYSTRPVTLSVKVAFPQGRITEWYPWTGNGTRDQDVNSFIQWDPVEVSPGKVPELPTGKSASHYYAARETDATPIRVGKQDEKMIFYRGVGSFAVSVRPAFTSDGMLEIRNTGAEPIPAMILFENRNGKIGYRALPRIEHTVNVETPELTGDLAALRRELAGTLSEFGLYPKEAAAMVETWRDSWFEEGMRLFYIVPRATVDSLLPLEVRPAAATTARVFVGRVEVLSPVMRETIVSALSTGDVPALRRYGRFLDVFMGMINRKGAVVQSPAAARFLRSRFATAPAQCAE